MPKISESPIASTKISIPRATPLRMLVKFWSKKFAASRPVTARPSIGNGASRDKIRDNLPADLDANSRGL